MTRYTPTELRAKADYFYMILRNDFASMLRQAADDAEQNAILIDALNGLIRLVDGTGFTDFEEYSAAMGAIDAARKETT